MMNEEQKTTRFVFGPWWFVAIVGAFWWLKDNCNNSTVQSKQINNVPSNDMEQTEHWTKALNDLKQSKNNGTVSFYTPPLTSKEIEKLNKNRW